MTEQESELLRMFRNLDRHEQSIIMGKLTEILYAKICGKKNCRIWHNEIKYYPIIFVYII
jgi:hypothetical protein